MSHTVATINALSEEAIYKLKAEDIITIGADAGALSLRALHCLNKSAFEAIDGAYFRAGKLNKLLKGTLNNLTPRQAASLSDETVKGLSINTIEDMEKGVRKSIDVTRLSAEQINKMQGSTLVGMDLTHVKNISPEVLANLSGASIAVLVSNSGFQIPASTITSTQLEDFLRVCGKHLTDAQLEQLAAIKPEIKENLPPSTILNASTKVAKALGFDTPERKELATLISVSEQQKLYARSLIELPAEIRAELSGRDITHSQFWEILGYQYQDAYDKCQADMAGNKPNAQADFAAKQYSTLLTPKQLAALKPHIIQATRLYALNNMVTSELAIIAEHLSNEQLAKLDVRKAYELGKAGFKVDTKTQGYVPMRRLAAFVGRRMPSAKSAATSTAG